MPFFPSGETKQRVRRGVAAIEAGISSAAGRLRMKTEILCLFGRKVLQCFLSQTQMWLSSET